MTIKKLSRKTLSIGAGALFAVALLVAFWPQPVLVDIGAVSEGPMLITINEEANTQAAELYVLSAPITGRLLRVEFKPGDYVEQGKTIVARMLPSPSGSEDTQQGQTAIQAAEAQVSAAQAALKQSKSAKQLADQQAKRSAQQARLGTLSDAGNEQAQLKAKNADAAVASATAALAIRRAELANVKAALLGSGGYDTATIDIKAPVSGEILRLIEENEKVLTAGAAILEIGDIANDLEVATELLSSDAVKIKQGQRVLIDNWGGEVTLQGVVSRIDPFGFIKTSALGVEERRVKAIITLQDLPASASGLGHGFRVDVAIVVWEKNKTTKVPASALFRENGQWTVFLVSDGKAQLRKITVEKNNGSEASISEGLQVGDRVILYPAADLIDGTAVAQR